MRRQIITATIAALVCIGNLLAGETPPADSKPLSDILLALEAREVGTIAEAEFDDGLWEVKVLKEKAWHKLYIDPKTGAENRRRGTGSEELPPANALALSKIVKSVEALNLGTISEVELEDGRWEVELRNAGRKVKLYMKPLAGKEIK